MCNSCMFYTFTPQSVKKGKKPIHFKQRIHQGIERNIIVVQKIFFYCMLNKIGLKGRPNTEIVKIAEIFSVKTSAIHDLNKLQLFSCIFICL